MEEGLVVGDHLEEGLVVVMIKDSISKFNCNHNGHTLN